MFKYFIVSLLVITAGCNNQQTTTVINVNRDSGKVQIKPASNLKWYDSLILKYIRQTNNPMVSAIRKDSSVEIQWLLDSRQKTDTASYLIFQIGNDVSDSGGTNLRFAIAQWLYIDSLTKNIYEYDVANDTLLLAKY